MAAPDSARGTYWLRGYSGLGELLDVDYEAISLVQLSRTVKHRLAIEVVLSA